MLSATPFCIGSDDTCVQDGLYMVDLIYQNVPSVAISEALQTANTANEVSASLSLSSFNISTAGNKINIAFDMKAGDSYTVVVSATTDASKTTNTFKTYTAKKDDTVTYKLKGKEGNAYNVSIYEGKINKNTISDAGSVKLTLAEFSLAVTPKLKKAVIGDDQVSFTITNWTAVKNQALTVQCGDQIVTLPAGGGSSGNVSIDAGGKVAVTGLNSNTKYTFSVSSSIGPFAGVAGDLPLVSKTVTLKLKTNKTAYEQVKGVTVEAGADTLSVSWYEVYGKDGGGEAKGYTITVTNVNTGKVAKTVNVSNGMTEGTVKDLKPDTEYVVTVRANADKKYSVGLASDAVPVTTLAQLTLNTGLFARALKNTFTIELGTELLGAEVVFLSFSLTGKGTANYGGDKYTDSASVNFSVRVDLFAGTGSAVRTVYAITKKHKEQVSAVVRMEVFGGRITGRIERGGGGGFAFASGTLKLNSITIGYDGMPGRGTTSSKLGTISWELG